MISKLQLLKRERTLSLTEGSWGYKKTMTNIFRAIAVSTALYALILLAPIQTAALAQGGGSTPRATMSSSTPNNPDQEHHNWGWLGLLGLLGLAGLRRRTDTTYTPDIKPEMPAR
ncbi:MAG: WGxxGxxG-CTERM domain-containing protein [Candidatus Eremiobacteraeota bacterium]|nr:WGxxGxxG-CTERM domain-containing protein [Candidatus Eremiobacteraeota bacterium]